MKISGRAIGVTVGVALVGSVPLVLAFNAGASTTEHMLSQGRVATSSSVEDSALAPGNAVDGKTTTRWASKEGADPQWIAVDLGATRDIKHVSLKWETAYAKTYQVQVSPDAQTWTTLYHTTAGNGGTDDLTGLTGSGRYVRVYGTKRGTRYGYSLYEFQVFGDGSGTPAPGPVPSDSTSPTASPSPSTSASGPSTKPGKPPVPGGVGVGGDDLSDPHKKEIAMELVSSAENSSLDWQKQYAYIEDIGDGRGYTAGIIGFCSGTGDMEEMIQIYTKMEPNNILAKYLPALHKVDGSDSHAGLAPNFPTDWKTAANDPVFRKAQDQERDAQYFNPALDQAKKDGLQALGQFIYYDAAVMHGADETMDIRTRALKKAKPPSQGGDEVSYLNAYLDERIVQMKKEAAHDDTSRVDTEQRVFLKNGNLTLNTPLSWKTYGDPYSINH